MSRRDELIQLVTELIIKTSLRIDLLHQRLPKPGEFAEDIVDYLGALSNAEEKERSR